VSIVTETYSQAKDIADAVRLSVDNFTGESNGVNQAVKLWPMGAQVRHQPINLAVVTHIAVKNQFAVKGFGKFGGALFETLAHIAQGNLGTLLVTRARNPIGNGTVGQNAGDQQLFTGEKTFYLRHGAHLH
jgi:hypothetical protein